MKPKIHVVAFQRPYPPTYGGVIDMYFRLKALHEAGLHVTLHTFAYHDRMSHTPELQEVADEVFYYERNIGLKSQLSLTPYIVISRRNETLLSNLLKDDAPILFEGLHSTYYLTHPLLKQRYKIVRAHNIEHHYYKALAFSPGRLRDRLYYLIEAAKLKLYEPVLRHADLIASLNETEASYFRTRYRQVPTKFIPVFFDDTLPPVEATGSYVLYHGNLSVAENVKAAQWILKEVAQHMPDTRFIIAGYNPPKKLVSNIHQYGNVTLIDSPSDNDMEELISKANLHLLLTFQPTGVKLKLLHVLSRHGLVIANDMMVDGTNLEANCIIANTPEEIRSKIRRHITSTQRSVELNPAYSTLNNAMNLINEIPYYHYFCSMKNADTSKA